MLDNQEPELDAFIFDSEHQNILFEALSTKDKWLAKRYQGALMVLKDASSPYRYPLAAHCMREIMGKLPYYIDVPLQSGYNLNRELNNLMNVILFSNKACL